MEWRKAIFIKFYMDLCWYVKCVTHLWCMYYVCVCGLNTCVYYVNWVGVLYNVGIRVLWRGGGDILYG